MTRRGLGSSTVWEPRTLEDHLLHGYWRNRGGKLYLEVPIGGAAGAGKWSNDSTTRRIDGVCVGFGREVVVRYARERSQDFASEVEKGFVELIEVKAALNRTAIGQAIAARHMFTRQYGRSPNRVLILCQHSDSALEWVCAQENVDVEVMRPVPSADGTIGYEAGPGAPTNSARLESTPEADDFGVEDLGHLDTAQAALTSALKGDSRSRRRTR